MLHLGIAPLLPALTRKTGGQGFDNVLALYAQVCPKDATRCLMTSMKYNIQLVGVGGQYRLHHRLGNAAVSVVWKWLCQRSTMAQRGECARSV